MLNDANARAAAAFDAILHSIMTNLPFVSMLLSVHNDADTIVRALGAVLDQRYPRDRMEVLVGDALSDDGTFAILQRATYDRRVRLFDNPRRTAAAALNTALAQARGEIIVRLDGRTVIAPNYLVSCVEALEQSGADYVSGSPRTVGATPWGRAAALAAPLAAAFGAYRRAALERVGGWNEALEHNEDDELDLRLRAADANSLAASSLRAVSHSGDTPSELWRQRFAAGVWRVAVLLRHPAATRPRDVASAALVLALGGGAALATFKRRVRRLWLALAAFYALTLLATSLLAARRAGALQEGEGELRWREGDLGPLDGGARRTPAIARWAVWLRLPLAIACQQWAYGCGVLVGVVRAFTPLAARR